MLSIFVFVGMSRHSTSFANNYYLDTTNYVLIIIFNSIFVLKQHLQSDTANDNNCDEMEANQITC